MLRFALGGSLTLAASLAWTLAIGSEKHHEPPLILPPFGISWLRRGPGRTRQLRTATFAGCETQNRTIPKRHLLKTSLFAQQAKVRSSKQIVDNDKGRLFAPLAS